MDYFDILLAKKLSGGGGGEIEVESLTATENGTYNAGTGKAYNPVVVAVPEPTLITKSISQNGTYNASDDNADGYSSVTVDVEGYQIKNIPNVPADIASFSDGTDLPMPSLVIGIEPVQDLHGYDAPWVGGAGKNKLQVTATTRTLGGVTFTINDDGTVTVNGTASGWQAVYNNYGNVQLKANTEYILTSEGRGSQLLYVDLYNGTTKIASTDYQVSQTFSVEEDITATLTVVVYNNKSVTNQTIKPMIRLATETDPTYEPYSNICPISGWTGAEIHVADGETPHIVDNVVNVSWQTEAGTVYGGELDVTSGVLTVTHANIASYNGESINEPWISSEDAYESGATPTTGAQVVYPLTTPLTVQLPSTQIKSLLGQNNLFVDSGQIISGQYFAEL